MKIRMYSHVVGTRRIGVDQILCDKSEKRIARMIRGPVVSIKSRQKISIIRYTYRIIKLIFKRIIKCVEEKWSQNDCYI